MTQKHSLAIIIALTTLATSVATLLLILKRIKEEDDIFYDGFKDECGSPDDDCCSDEHPPDID